jgi:hypothetical protein
MSSGFRRSRSRSPRTVSLLSIIWVGTYLALGLPISAAIPFAYQVVSIASLAVFARTKDYRFFRASQLALIFLLPFLLQWSLGGYVASSAVSLWMTAIPTSTSGSRSSMNSRGPISMAAAVRRAIELSATRYCTASAMFSAGPAEIHHRYLVGRCDGRPAEDGEVVVTGPGDDTDALGERWLASNRVVAVAAS